MVPGHPLAPKVAQGLRYAFMRSNVSSGLSRRFALSIALPYTQGIRLPTTDGIQTSLMRSKDNLQLSVPDADRIPSSFPPGFSAGSSVIHFIGQPGCLGYVWKQVVGGGKYQIYFDNNAGTGRWQLAESLGSAGTTEPGPWEPVSAVYDRNGPGEAIHGQTMAIGRSSGMRFVYLNIGDKLELKTFVSSGTYTSLTLKILIKKFLHTKADDGLLVEQAFQTVTPPATQSVIFTADQNAYFSVEIIEVTSVGGTATGIDSEMWVTLSSATYAYAQISMGDLDIQRNGDAQVGLNCRLSASGLLVTNTSPAISAGGVMTAARQNSFMWHEATEANIANLAQKYVGNAAHGIYTFREANDKMLTFDHTTDPSRQFYAAGLFFDLDRADWVHTIHITSPGTGSSNQYNVIFESCLEFTTDSARYSRAQADGTLQDLMEAKKAINSVPEWFYENPEHMKRLYNFVKKAGALFIDHAPQLAAGASAVFPAQTAAINAALQLLRALRVGN